MKFQVICLLIYGIRSSFQLNENYCYNASTDNHFCCFNYEWTNQTCIECKIGTTTRKLGGRCLPCKRNMYGETCSETCDCNPVERYNEIINKKLSSSQNSCDQKVGCISKKTDSTVSVQFLNETVTEKMITFIKDGSSNHEWIIYILCITGLTILICVGHLIRKIRKKRLLELKINAEIGLETFNPTPCIGIYSAVDENPLVFDTTDLNLPSQASSMETAFFISQRRQFITTDIADDETTGYLDVYFDIENDKTKIDDRVIHLESFSNNSLNSDVARKDNTENRKPYTELQHNRQEDSNACEVIVTVHQCSESSSMTEEDISNIHANVVQPIQTDIQIQRQENENRLSPITTTVNGPALHEANPLVFKTRNLQDCTNNLV